MKLNYSVVKVLDCELWKSKRNKIVFALSSDFMKSEI